MSELFKHRLLQPPDVRSPDSSRLTASIKADADRGALIALPSVAANISRTSLNTVQYAVDVHSRCWQSGRAKGRFVSTPTGTARRPVLDALQRFASANLGRSG